MTIEYINIGTTANDQTGDPLRIAFGKINNSIATLASTALPAGPDGSVQFRSTNNLQDIAYLNGTYLAVGYPSRISTSTDMVQWTPQVSPSSATALTAISDGTQFVAVGTLGMVMTSTNGQDWTLQTTGITDNLTSVAYDGTTYYVAVADTGVIIRSPDSINWTVMSSPTAQPLTDIVYSSAHAAFIAVGAAGTIIVSTDGAIWNTQVSGIAGTLNSVAVYNTTVLTVGALGRILVSQDLVNWNIRSSTTAATLSGVTIATLGSAVTAFAVGTAGTLITSSDANFITWDDTTYPSPTTLSLVNAETLNSQAVIIGEHGAIFVTSGGSWTDTGISAGLDGSSRLIFEPLVPVLSIDADFIPQTSNVWSLGSNTNRFDNAFFSSNGISIGAVVTSEFAGNLHIASAANTSNLAGIVVKSVNADTITANTSTVETITVTDTATVTNLAVSGNTSLANLTVANITIDNITTNTITTTTIVATGNVTAANGDFSGRVTATEFYGDGSHLTGIVNKAEGTINSVQFANANLDFAGSAAFTYDSANGELTVPAVITSDITTTDILANDVYATRLHGDGSNITGLPVAGIVAGANIAVTDNAGIWTITALGDGNTQSHGPLNSIQFAGPSGTFDSVSGFTYDTANANLELPAANIIAKRVFANVTGILTGNVIGNIAGANATMTAVTATTITGNLFGNLTGNVVADTGNVTDLTAGNLTVTGTQTVNDFVANTATIAGIDFANNTLSSATTIDISSYGALTLSTADSLTDGVPPANITISGGAANGLVTGATVSITSGSGGTSGNAGDVKITGADGGTNGQGGNVTIRGGSGNLAAGGDINIIAGDTQGDPFTSTGANVYVQGGNTIDEDGGAIILKGGTALGSSLYGGNIYIEGGAGTLGHGNIFLANLRWPLTDGISGAVLGTDGTGNLDWVTGIAAASLANGTSNITIPQVNSNIQMSVGGISNVVTVTNTGIRSNNITLSGEANAQTVRAVTYIGVDAVFSGNVVLGNVTLLGPINVASIDNGNTHVRATANSDVIFEVAGVANAVVMSSTGTTINGSLTVDTVDGDLIPTANVVYDLGNVTNRWRDLYLYGNTIYIGDAEISSWQEIVLLKGLSITMDGQVDPGNVPAAGDLFVANNLSAGNAVLSNVVLSNFVLSGTATFDSVDAGNANIGNLIVNNLSVTGNIDVSELNNGTSNVVVADSGNITFSVDSVPNVLTVTDTTVLANSFTSNNFILGDATSTAVTTTWVKAQTATTTPDQVLFEMPAAGQNSVDFKVIAVDIPTQNKQSSMITTVTYGTSTSYSEYARTVINTVISDLSVDQNSGNIRLLASPRVAYLIRYTVIVSIY